MLANLPASVCCVLLMVVGAVISALINWAIYSWSVFSRRPVSPWMRLLDDEQAELGDRTWLDRIPVYGWIRLRRHHDKAWTWIRPMLIDVVWIIGLPWFWHWQLGGGLLGFNSGTLPVMAQWSFYAEVWFWSHTLLIALLFIATFIDFDERLIPDQITVPGTIAGLCIAAALPSSRLPEIAATPAGMVVAWINFRSPHPFPAQHWCFSWVGLALALGVFTIWILSLFPRISPFHLGIGKGIKFTFASVLRPKRKTKCALRTVERGPFGLSKILVAILLVGLPLLVLAWMMLPTANWISLMGAVVGMAVAGGLIWGIRLVGGAALGMQVMGFGDVTLMAMIGTFIGWQASASGFVYGIIVAMVCAMILLAIFRDSYLAFGPYLAFGAVFSIFRWHQVWLSGQHSFFAFGAWLLLVLLVSLVLMAVLLPLVRWLKVKTLGADM